MKSWRSTLIRLTLALTLTGTFSSPYAMELQALSEGEMAECRAQMGLSAALVPALVPHFEKRYLPGQERLFSADISGEAARHIGGTMHLEGDTLILDHYTVQTPERTYAHVRPAGFQSGPDFGTFHMGERIISVSGYIRIFQKP